MHPSPPSALGWCSFLLTLLVRFLPILNLVGERIFGKEFLFHLETTSCNFISLIIFCICLSPIPFLMLNLPHRKKRYPSPHPHAFFCYTEDRSTSEPFLGCIRSSTSGRIRPQVAAKLTSRQTNHLSRCYVTQ